ncbi:MAG: hypothetical protein B7Y88_13230 [Sphingomonadales bacterium 32-64-17]|nr:MAG: hypothetical protein B7Y88_13230 [Sphingomonadales bacterium 32-64-17]
MAAIDVPAALYWPMPIPRALRQTGRGLLRWRRDVAASHCAYLAEREIRLERKLALNPITPAQLCIYRLLL